VEWITDCIDTLRRTGKAVIEATEQAQEEWRTQVNEVVSKTLFTRANSWYMGANIPGKPRTFLPYLDPAGLGGYRKICDEVAAKGYAGFEVA
jgi:cyclohexanone monooxygenase